MIHQTTSILLHAALAAHLAACPQAPEIPDPGNQRLGDSILLVAREAQPGVQIPGLFGRLHLNPGQAVAMPIDENSRNIHDVVQQIGRQIGGTGFFQVVRTDENGLQISTLRALGEDAPLAMSQNATESDCRAIALEYVLSVRGTSDAPEWSAGALPGRAEPLYRPDVQGVAYFEFAVSDGGFIVVSTGTHDVPVPHWGSAGSPHVARLRDLAFERGRVPGRCYRIDSMSYAIEDVNGQLVDHIGELPRQLHGVPTGPEQQAGALLSREWVSWRDLKANYADVYRPFLRQVHQVAEQRKAANTIEGTSSWTPWRYHYAEGGASDQPRYDQFDYGSCKVGCGPVAWAILFGWGDNQAHDKNPVWASRTGLYRANGGYGTASAVAPKDMYSDQGIYNVIRELNDRMKTSCFAGGGLTLPWNMKRAEDYLKGRTGAKISVAYNSASFAEPRLRNKVRDSIVKRDTPAVIGNMMGGGKHYPVAYAYRWRSKRTLFGVTYDRQFKVNPGWGSASFSWVDARTWFAGELLP